MLLLSDHVLLGENYSLIPLEDEYFFLPNTTEGVAEEKLFALNSLGHTVVQLIDGYHTISDICMSIEKEYNADEETICTDVLNFLQDLLNKGLIMKK